MTVLAKPLAWLAVLGGAAGIAASFWQAGSPAPEGAPEPDYFAFVKPLAESQPVPAAPAAVAPAAGEAASGPMQAARVELAVQKLRAAGAGEDAVYRLRAGKLSADTAARLAAMERDELAWQARIDAYLKEWGALQKDGPEAERASALQQLRDARFSAEEQGRLAASLPATLQLTQN